MDFTLSPDAVAYRDLVRSIIADTVTDEAIDEIHRTGTFDLPALNFALAKHGLLERIIRNNFNFVTHLFNHKNCGIFIKHLVDRCHNAHLHQNLDELT